MKHKETSPTVLPESKGRIEYMDAVKAVAISLVLFGHAVQYTSTAGTSHPLWAVIYSVHMPLFMIVSGFFASSSLRLPLGRLCMKKGLQLLLPGIVWSLLTLHFAPRGMFNLFWFLSCLFICNVLTWCGTRLFPRNTAAAAFSSMAVALLFIPVVYVNAMFPFFWAGRAVFLHREKLLRTGTGTNAALWAAFVCMLFFWNSDYTIYFTPLHPIVSHGKILFDPHEYTAFLFRLLIGATGSLAIILSARHAYGYIGRACRQWFVRIGGATMGIYILQHFTLEILFLNISYHFSDTLTFAAAPLLTVAELLLCYGLCRLIGRSRLLDGLLLGGFRLQSRNGGKRNGQ